jgi:DNA-binding MarR family transcriptional regulator
MPDSLFFKLVRVVNLTARPFQQRVGQAQQLKLNEWRVMAVLGRHPGSTATQVAQQTGLDKMSVSRALGGLKRAKRLRAEDDPSDQRCSRLYLTAAGKALHELVDARAREREAELFQSLTPAECEQLAATLDKLIASVSAADTPQ